MKLILTNLQKVLTKTSSLSATIISIMAIGFLFTYFKDTELIIGNLGLSFYLLEIALDTSISLLFGLFIGASVYKMIYFSSPKKKQLGLGGLAGFFGVLVGGCPACSITVASYLGLASILSVLPYDGMELKVLSLIMLLYVVYDILKTLEVCSVKKLKKCKIKK